MEAIATTIAAIGPNNAALRRTGNVEIEACSRPPSSDSTALCHSGRQTESGHRPRVTKTVTAYNQARGDEHRRCGNNRRIGLHLANRSPEPVIEEFQRNFSQVLDSSPRRVTVESPSVP